MNSDINIARAHGADQAVNAIRQDGFDVSIEESDMTDNVTRVFCNSAETRDMLKEIFDTENSITYSSDLAVIIVEMSPDEVEDHLRRALP